MWNPLKDLRFFLLKSIITFPEGSILDLWRVFEYTYLSISVKEAYVQGGSEI